MLTVLALTAIAAGTGICVGSMVRLWRAARKVDKGDDGSCTDMEY
jgi:hypothetical protein